MSDPFSDPQIFEHDGYRGKLWPNGLSQLSLYHKSNDTCLGIFYHVPNERAFQLMVDAYIAGRQRGYGEGERAKTARIINALEKI